MDIKAPRGTYDILPDQAHKWHYIEKCAHKTADLYGYREIRTPVFEQTELFVRGIGEYTDIVKKEMYVFKDKKGRSMTLRPEGTATVVRACLEHNLAQNSLTKLYYIGPFMRYERPQAGRFRQFHQFGFEALGSRLPSLDAEIIQATFDFFLALGLKDLQVEINSLGCKECRPAYKEALVTFFNGKTEELCSECNNRLTQNPLRILDCKSKSCREISHVAPSIFGYLCSECKSHFTKLQEYLESVKLPFSINPLIVRGLDYYTKTVFEIITTELGSQDALCGGGRYDQLAEEIGGKSIPAVGVAIGLERSISILEKRGIAIPGDRDLDIYLVALGDESDLVVHRLQKELRDSGFYVERDYMGRGLKNQMKEAHHRNARLAAIVGADELKAKSVTLKDMKTGEQKMHPVKSVIDIVKKRLEGGSWS